VSRSPHRRAARAFVARLRSAAGQALLARYGFLPLGRGA
jgi:ABC-type molybdate transport system substrate-binding protein